MERYSDMSIPQVGLGRSGNWPLGGVGSAAGIALKRKQRVGNFLANFRVLDLVEKIVNSYYRSLRAC